MSKKLKDGFVLVPRADALLKQRTEWRRQKQERQKRGLKLGEKPKERRIAVFQRWQQMRKARHAKLPLSHDDQRFCVCACGLSKPCSRDMCYECQDMLMVVRERIPMAGAVEIEERYGRVYETPRHRYDVDYRSSRFEDSENLGGLHNIIRAMEDYPAYL